MAKIIGTKIPTFNDAADIPGALHSQVDVYYNLRRRLWSVRSRETGRVLGHCHTVSLRDVRFVVNAAGRDRVRLQGRKNVHAYCRGTVARGEYFPKGPWDYVAYNPYTVDTFCLATPDSTPIPGRPVGYARYAVLEGRDVLAKDPVDTLSYGIDPRRPNL